MTRNSWLAACGLARLKLGEQPHRLEAHSGEVVRGEPRHGTWESPRWVGCISAISRLCLGYISAMSRERLLALDQPDKGRVVQVDLAVARHDLACGSPAGKLG